MRLIRAMHKCMYYHRSAHPQKFYTFILHLSGRTFSGLVGKAAPPPVKFTPAFWHSWHLTIGLFCFKKYIPTLWHFGKNLRTPLCSWGFSIYFSVRRFTVEAPNLSASFYNCASDGFWKGDSKMSVNLLTVSAWSGFFCLFRFPRGVSALVAVFSVPMIACLAELFLWALVCSSFPCDYRGYKKIGGTASLCPGESACCLIFSLV